MGTLSATVYFQSLLTYLFGFWPILVGLPIGLRVVRHWWPEAQTSPLWLIPATLTIGLGTTIAVTFALLTCRIAFLWMLIVVSIPSLVLWWFDFHFWRQTIHLWKNNFAAADSIDRLSTLGFGIIAFTLLILARIPPLNYDAHEYHLAVPEHYAQAGGWVTLPLNVFAGFPMNVELLYFWGLAWNSIASTTVIHTVLCLGAALGAGGIARLLGCRRSGLAVLIYSGSGLLQLQCLQGNIDHGPALFGAVALMGLLVPSTNTLGWAALSSTALGLALGCKYVTVISVALPWFLLVVWRITNDRITSWKPFVILFSIPALIVAPWLIRNALLYGNPFHPLLPAWFQFASWNAVSARFFRASVSPKEATLWGQLVRFGANLPSWTIGNPLNTDLGLMGWLLWNTKGHIALLGVLLMAFPSRKSSDSYTYAQTLAIRFASFGVLLSISGWIHLTQGEERFLIPLYPLLSAMAVYGWSKLPDGWGTCLTWAGSANTTLFIAFTVALSLNPYSYLIGQVTEREFLSSQLPHFRAIEYLNHLSRKENINVLFIGEAQETGARFPRCVTVVYNQHPLLDFDSEGNVLPLNMDTVRQKLLDMKMTHLFVNLWELKRLTDGYGPMGWKQGTPLRQIVIQLETDGILEPIPDSTWNGRPGYTIYRVNAQ